MKHKHTLTDKQRLWVDDVRPMPALYDYWCKSVIEAKKYIKDHYDKIELISLDHDAGDYGTDYIAILDWLDREHHKEQLPFKIRIHTGNPVGAANMRRIIRANGWEEYEDEWD